MGVVSFKGNNDELVLSNMAIGADRAKALGAAVKLAKASTLHLDNNRLTVSSSLKILQNLSTQVAVLNLSNNVLQDFDKQKELLMKKHKESKYGKQKELHKKENQFNL